MASRSIISKIKLQQTVLYIDSIWEENDRDLFGVTIYGLDRVWCGKFPIELVDNFRENVDENREEYLSNVQKALQGDHVLFVYDFVIDPDNTSTAKFNWKRKFLSDDESTVLLLHGSVEAQHDMMKNKDFFIDSLLSENLVLKSNLSELKSFSDDLRKKLELCRIELDNAIMLKSNLEEFLYGKFTQVLNKKKERLKLLKENLMNLESGHNSLNID